MEQNIKSREEEVSVGLKLESTCDWDLGDVDVQGMSCENWCVASVGDSETGRIEHQNTDGRIKCAETHLVKQRQRKESRTQREMGGKSEKEP